MNDNGCVQRQSIGLDLAQRMIEASKAKADDLGKGFTIAVVDDSGVLVAHARMDNAPLVSVQLAQDKAYTSVGFSLPSHGWYDFIKDDGPLALGAPAAIDRLVVFGGGYPIIVDGATVGGIGVSGGYYTEDMDVAEAGLEVLPADS